MLVVGPYLLLNSCNYEAICWRGLQGMCRPRWNLFQYLYIYTYWMSCPMYLTNISPTWVFGHEIMWNKYHILMAKEFRECIGCFLWSLRFSFSPVSSLRFQPLRVFGGSQDLISTISASVSNANAAISACQRQWRQAFGTLVENLYLTFVDKCWRRDTRHRFLGSML